MTLAGWALSFAEGPHLHAMFGVLDLLDGEISTA